MKPANVIVDVEGHPHLMDFGLARREIGEVTLTVDGQVLGTPAYMSPEQAGGEAHQADRRSDVYSLGVILFQLLTGELPFRGNARMLLHQVIHEEAPSPRKLNANIDRDLETICLKCLEKLPSRRYATAQLVADELDRYLKGESILARPIGALQRGWRWCRRKPLVAGLGTAAILAMVMGTVVSTYFGVAARKSARKAEAAFVRVEQEKNRAQQNADLAEERFRVAQRRAYSDQMARVGQMLNSSHSQALSLLHNEDVCPPELREFTWHYFNHRLKRESVILTGHQGKIVSVTYSPDGRLLASGGNDTKIRIWDPISGKLFRELEGHEGPVTSVRFSPDGRLIASASHDTTARIWDVATGAQLLTFTGHTKGLGAVAFSPDGSLVASASSDYTIKIWKAESGQEIRTLEGHRHWVWSVDFSPDGKSLASGGRDGWVILWNLESGREVRRFNHEGEAFYVEFSPDGETLAVTGFNYILRLLDLRSKKERWRFGGAGINPVTFAFAPDGKSIASANTDHTVRIWDAKTGQQQGVLPGHTDSVQTVAFSPDGKTLSSASDDQTIRLWKLDSEEDVFSLREPGNVTWDLEFLPGGHQLVLIDQGSRTLQICEAKTGWPVRFLRGHKSAINCFEISHDGKLLATSSRDTIKLWDFESGRELHSLRADVGWIISLAFSPDNRTLAAAGMDLRIKTWDTSSFVEKLSIEHPRTGVTRLVFSEDGSQLASSGLFDFHGDVAETILWDAASGKDLLRMSGHNLSASWVDFSPDGSMLATAGADGTICTWDAESGELQNRCVGHADRVWAASFSPDGKTLASCSNDRNIRLWDPATGRHWATLSGHNAAVGLVKFSTDGRSLISASLDGSLLLWESEPVSHELQVRRKAVKHVYQLFRTVTTKQEAISQLREDENLDPEVVGESLKLVHSGWDSLLQRRAWNLLDRMSWTGEVWDRFQEIHENENEP